MTENTERKLYGFPRQNSSEEEKRIEDVIRKFSLVVVVPKFIAFQATPEQVDIITRVLGIAPVELKTRR